MANLPEKLKSLGESIARCIQTEKQTSQGDRCARWNCRKGLPNKAAEKRTLLEKTLGFFI